MTRVVICGGGLSGGLAAIAFAIRRPDVELMLLEATNSFGGNHVWSFFDTDVTEDSSWLRQALASHRWPDHEIRFPRRSRVLGIGYNSIRSNDLDAAVRTLLSPTQYRLSADVTEVGPGHAVVDDERIEADCVVDARGPGQTAGLELGWQKFVGRIYRSQVPHGIVRPVIMDATVPQMDGYRFVYLLPLGLTELLIEDTYYSSSRLLDVAELGGRLEQNSKRFGAGEWISEEQGVLPVVVEGKLADLWPASDPVPRLGLHGGFFHPTTGYSLPDALANAVLLTEQPDLSAAAVWQLLHSRAERLWRERHFFQLLNRMLFRAAEPSQRYRILEHFYRLPPALISRFYAARLTNLDKLRILTGAPPVSISAALSALWAKAA